MSDRTRVWSEPRVIAGVLAMIFGVVLAVGYDAKEYELQNTLWSKSSDDYVRAAMANQEKERQRDLHQIAIAVCLGFGAFMTANGVWRARRKIKESKLEQLAGAVKAEQLLDVLDDVLDD